MTTEHIWIPFNERTCEKCNGQLAAELLQMLTYGGPIREWSGSLRCTRCHRRFEMTKEEVDTANKVEGG